MNNYCFIIPAGGLGSRLYPLTKNEPKPYLPLYNNDKEIIRLIDLPLTYAKQNNINTYIALDYLKEKLLYIKEKYNTTVIETHYEMLSDCLLELLNSTKEETLYSVYAPDFLIPTKDIDKMIKLIDTNTETIALCSKNNDYSKIKIKNNNGYLSYTNGEKVTDLTFHIGRIDKGKTCFSNIDNILNIWKYLHPQDSDLTKAKIYLSDIEHIDIGTPNDYYEIVYKLNKKDSNGNVIFPGAKINKLSKNIIALPHSDSSNIILENAIVPENEIVSSYEEVLTIKELGNKFKKIKIKDYIGEIK